MNKTPHQDIAKEPRHVSCITPTDAEIAAQNRANRAPKNLPPPRVCAGCEHFKPAASALSHLGYGWCALLPDGHSMSAAARCHFSPSKFQPKEA